ncbi:molybdenum cofactor guanylyltransferase [Galbitalea soli]|uniref:NTP transferase domain-containing protein n=1 Tax=Galbitalea soli TaxID=1268042 RepID=A0A7C9PME9_9MICO|nr:NTP transferase domain-containing protein [Galbitalea soli]NEM90688.1 NTP transferase domain-containing protein [Galbitalea soli]NYJ31406.1 molybdopterin-guanine dinucleotide biosynthesis protein A [Galbitalea soli]
MARDEAQDWDAIILAGGRSTRLDGFDKTALVYRGHSLLDHALAAVTDARAVAVIGPLELRPRLERVAARGRLTLATEHPRFGGPGCAVARGLESLPLPASVWTAVIAADQPHIGLALSTLLDERRRFPAADALIARDEAGELQPLTALYRTARLAAAVAAAGPLDGIPMRALIGRLSAVAVPLGELLCADIDTFEDAAAHDIVVRRA